MAKIEGIAYMSNNRSSLFKANSYFRFPQEKMKKRRYFRWEQNSSDMITVQTQKNGKKEELVITALINAITLLHRTLIDQKYLVGYQVIDY